MDVSKATATPVSAVINSAQQQPPEPKNDKQPEQQSDSAVVKLSAQAQRMNRAENQSANTGHTETRPQKTAEPPGIQLIKGEHKGGHVNTFA